MIASLVPAIPPPVLPPVCLVAVQVLLTLLRHALAQVPLNAVHSSATLQATLANHHVLPPQLQDYILLAAIVRAVLNALQAPVTLLELISVPPTVLAQQTC